MREANAEGAASCASIGVTCDPHIAAQEAIRSTRESAAWS